MKNLIALFGAAVIALMMLGPAGGAAPRDADAEKDLKAVEAQWNQEYEAKDLDKVLAHYAADAVVMAPGMPGSAGSEAIRNTIRQMVADPALSLKFKASKMEVAKSGDLAYTQGSYTMTMTDPNSKQVITDHGSYVTVYRKEDGAWKAVSDIASSEIPPSAPTSK